MKSIYHVTGMFGVAKVEGYCDESIVVDETSMIINRVKQSFKREGPVKYVNFQQEVNPSTTAVLDAPSYMPYDCLYIIQNVGKLSSSFTANPFSVVLSSGVEFLLYMDHTGLGDIAVFRLSGASSYPSLKNAGTSQIAIANIVMIE